MIFEQAFFALPEFLVGTGFTRYDTEGTLVMAFAMAVLQELNGRNVNNPIAALSGEKTYPSASSRTADLFLDYSIVGTHNKSLEAFGAHATSWLETKFFRKNGGIPTADKTSATYALLRDLVRLACFPPHSVGSSLQCGRYLLHAYEGSYVDHLALKRNVGGGGGRTDRGWLKGLHAPGTSTLAFGALKDEPDEFDKQVGSKLRDLEMSATVTTLHVGGASAQYNLYLSRIESFKATYDSATVEGSSSGSTENPAGSWAAFSSKIDSALAK
jgi:hypothetical protein